MYFGSSGIEEERIAHKYLRAPAHANFVVLVIVASSGAHVIVIIITVTSLY